MVYFFDIEKCKCCPYRGGCYKEGAKKKTYTETIICDSHSEQVKFQETEHFKEKIHQSFYDSGGFSVRQNINCLSFSAKVLIFHSLI